jgi:hypothetical protein
LIAQRAERILVVACARRHLSYPAGKLVAVDYAQSGRATAPEDLGRLIVARLNAGDVDGLVALYEPGAVLELPGGRTATGAAEIRAAYGRLLADRPVFAPGTPLPTLRTADLALTSTRLADGTVTVEVARRQPDGTWLWVLDRPVAVPPPDAAGQSEPPPESEPPSPEPPSGSEPVDQSL